MAFAVALIKEHGAEKARPMFTEKVGEFDGLEWAAQAGSIFDLAESVAAGAIKYDDGGEHPQELPQELAKAIIAGDVPSNASKPGPARDVAMNTIKPTTRTLQ